MASLFNNFESPDFGRSQEKHFLPWDSSHHHPMILIVIDADSFIT